MTSTITYFEELPPGAQWLRHARCGATYPVETIETEFEKPVCRGCEDQEPGAGYGFHVARMSSALERTGGEPYAPVPLWLLKGERYALDQLEFRVLMVLIGFQGGNPSSRPHELTIARVVGRGERQVRRALQKLVERGLVERRRPSRRGGNRYDVVRSCEVTSPTASNAARWLRHRSPMTSQTGHP